MVIFILLIIAVMMFITMKVVKYMRTARRWNYDIQDTTIKPLILHMDTSTITFAGPYKQVRLQRTGQNTVSSDFVIDWGDGTINTYSDLPITAASDAIIHEYANYDTQCVATIFASEATFSLYGSPIVKIEGCLPPLFNNGTTMEYTFSQCHGLSEIADTVFKYNPQVLVFGSLFSGCVSLLTVPENIFKPCTKILSIIGMFEYSALTVVPENLFKYNTEMINFNGVFSECEQLETVPENIFKYNTKVTIMSSIFSCFTTPDIDWETGETFTTSRSKLNYVPENLFRYNTEVINFYGCFEGSLFLESIPEHIFRYNTKVENFTTTFGDCAKLTGITENLFKNNPKVTSFYYTFRGCKSLKIPSHLFDTCTLVTSFYGVFTECSNIDVIPDNLFINNINVTTFEYSFSNLAITSIPESLFATCTKVTTFRYAFNYCNKLLGIPLSLFSNNTQLTDVSYCFILCTGIVQNVPELWNLSYITSFTRCFYYCTSASNYASIPAGWKT